MHKAARKIKHHIQPNGRHTNGHKSLAAQLLVARQLKRIYTQSKKKPYQTAGAILLGLGAVTGALLWLRLRK